MGNQSCKTKIKRQIDEENIARMNWDLLTIIQKLLHETCPTSSTIDQLATILKNLVVELNKLDSTQSKEKVAAIFNEDFCKRIQKSYSDWGYDTHDKLHYNKLLKKYKETYNKQIITQEEGSRIFHNLASNIRWVGFRKCEEAQNYSRNKKLLDKMVELQCIQSIVQRIGQKLTYVLEQLNKQTQRMKNMLRQICKKFKHQLNALSYDLQKQSDYIAAAEISKFACQHHENGIYFLLVYFKKCFDRLEKKGTEILDIQKLTKKVLEQLGKRYRPGQAIPDLEQYTESFNLLKYKKDAQYNYYEFSKEDDKLIHLSDIIIVQEAQKAYQLKDKFEILISECCLKNSLWSKTNLKLDPNDSNKKSKSKIRILEKLFKKNKLTEKIQKIKHNLYQNYEQSLEDEEQGYQKSIIGVMQTQKSINFTITDMLRGKCIFSTIDDILVAIANIKEFIERNKDVYDLIEIENRFQLQKKPISDFTLKIQIVDQQGHKLIAELQLSLQSNFAHYNFAHKIYQFVRCQTFSKVKTLKDYYEEYKEQMTEMIVNLKSQNYLSQEEQKMILNYFLISDEDENTFSLQKSFYEKTKSLGKAEKSFSYFIKRFQDAQSLINMVVYRKLNMIDQEKVKIVENESNEFVKGMMVLQLLKSWDPYINSKGEQHYNDNFQLIWSRKPLRNRVFLERFCSRRDNFNQRSYLIIQLYGYHSLQNGKHLLKGAVNIEDLKPDEAQKDYKQAKECFLKSDQKDPILESFCHLRYLNFQLKSGKQSHHTLKELEDLFVKMRQKKKYMNALAIKLLISEYYLIHEKNHQLFDEHYLNAKEISKLQGVPFVGQLIHEIEFRICKHQFGLRSEPETKKMIFTNRLKQSISNVGKFKKRKELNQFLGSEFVNSISALGVQSPLTTNFQTHLEIRDGLSEHEHFLVSNTEFHNLNKIVIDESKVEGIKLCESIVKWKCPHLRYLNLNNNLIPDRGIRVLCEARWPLIALQLDNNEITDSGVKYLVKTDWPLRRLSLDRNKISDKGVSVLTIARWINLEHLHLEKNMIQDKQRAQEILQQIFQKAKIHIKSKKYAKQDSRASESIMIRFFQK